MDPQSLCAQGRDAAYQFSAAVRSQQDEGLPDRLAVIIMTPLSNFRPYLAYWHFRVERLGKVV